VTAYWIGEDQSRARRAAGFRSGLCRLGVIQRHRNLFVAFLLCAINGHMHRSKLLQSITSSALTSSDGGIVRPNVFAVRWLTTVSNFVGCSIGKSAGFAPLRMRST
jgi:hypothetical protein